MLMLALVLGALFCGLHLLNGWLLSTFEVTDHISLIYLPGFLRLANVLLLGMVWGSVATAIGGVMLMGWNTETWWLALSNAGVSAVVAGLSVWVMQLVLRRRLSLRTLSDLLKLALLYALLNALMHHLLWSVLDTSQLVDPNQLFFMVVGDVNGAVIGAFALRWIAQHTSIIQMARQRAMRPSGSDQDEPKG